MSSSRPSANIPLHSLSHRRYDSASEEEEDDDASLLDSDGEGQRQGQAHGHGQRARHGQGTGEKQRASSESDFSLFSDTGDIADQLDDDDPLQIHLPALQQPRSKRKHAHHKRKTVRYDSVEEHGYSEKQPRQRLRKEDIPIPTPPRRPLSFGHRLLAAAMAPGDGPSRIHGLHGKKLM